MSKPSQTYRAAHRAGYVPLTWVPRLLRAVRVTLSEQEEVGRPAGDPLRAAVQEAHVVH